MTMNWQTTAMVFSPLLRVACDKAPEADTAAQAAGNEAAVPGRDWLPGPDGLRVQESLGGDCGRCSQLTPAAEGLAGNPEIRGDGP
jgi:hypothetical protein